MFKFIFELGLKTENSDRPTYRFEVWLTYNDSSWRKEETYLICRILSKRVSFLLILVSNSYNAPRCLILSYLHHLPTDPISTSIALTHSIMTF